MAVIANRGIFGGGPYSPRAGRFLRELGRSPRHFIEFSIKPRRGGKKMLVNGRRMFRPAEQEPFMPKTFSDPYHPCGNSLGYMVQTAHLLGAEVIYAIGFTLNPSGPWHTGREHPLAPRHIPSFVDPCLNWLRWYESQFSGRVRLLPGFSGPVYDVLRTENLDAYRERLARERPESEIASPPAREPDAVLAHGAEGGTA